MKTSVKSQAKKSIKVDAITNPGVENSNPANEVVNDTIIKIVEKKQIKIGDEFIIKGGKFENDEDIFSCCALLENNQVRAFKKFNALNELQEITSKEQRYTFEVSEIKTFKSLVLLTESQSKILDKIDTFNKEEANSLQALRHVSNVCKVEQMGLNKCLKLFLTNAKGVLDKKQTDLLKFETVLEYLKTSRYRYNSLYTLNQMVLICTEILKINDFKTKVSAKVEKQGGLIGVQADKVSNKKAA